VTHQVTQWIAQHGVYAVFVLMAIDALLPVGGELIMLYAGVIAAGAVAGQSATLLGMHLNPGLESYVVLALAGSIGYLAGSIAGWAIGVRGGRSFVEKHGRLLHLGPGTLERAERWFARRGRAAVFLGRITPVVRSFISIPAGVLGSPFPSYVILTLLGSLIWCFGFAGVGWALGGSWQSFHQSFAYADYAAAALVVLAVIAVIVARRRRRARSNAAPGEGLSA
jgi:membrane protein DedA with SNARE-associated domain